MKSVIHRTHRNNRYCTINLDALEDPNLSALAVKVLYYALTRPPEWNLTTKDIFNRCKEGRDAVYKALNELISAGYMHRHQPRGDNGCHTSVELHWFESPAANYFANPDAEVQEAVLNSTPLPEIPDPVEPDPAEPHTTKNHGTNNHESKRDQRAHAREKRSLSENEEKGKAAAPPEIAYWRSQRAVSCSTHGLPLPDPSATDHDAAKMLALIELHLRGCPDGMRLQCIKDFLAAPPKNAFERGHRWGPPSFAGYAPLWRVDHPDIRPPAPPPEPSPVSHSEARALKTIDEIKAIERELANQTPEERLAKVRAARAAAGCAPQQPQPEAAPGVAA